MARGLPVRRQIDFTVGIPLVWLLGRLKRRRVMPGAPQRIVVLQNPAIGDTVLMTGPLADLRAAFPQAEIVLIAGVDNASIGPLLSAVDRVEVVDYANVPQTMGVLRRLPADLLIDFGTWPRINALYSATSPSRFTIGFSTPGQHRHFAYDLAVEHRADVHELENHRALIQAATGRPSTQPPLIVPPQLDAASAGQLTPDSPFIVFHAWASGTGKRLKEWPNEHWAQVAQWAGARGYTVLLTGGPKDRDDTAELQAAMKDSGATVRNIAGKASLAKSAAVAAKADAVVSVNTGLMHLAAAAGAPTIGLHGPTNSLRWGPVGRQTVSLIPRSGVHGYLNLGYEFPKSPEPCMALLEPVQVTEALDALLGTSPNR